MPRSSAKNSLMSLTRAHETRETGRMAFKTPITPFLPTRGLGETQPLVR